MSRTVVLRRDYLHYIKKYNRFEKRHHNLPAHCAPCFGRTRIGDVSNADALMRERFSGYTGKALKSQISLIKGEDD